MKNSVRVLGGAIPRSQSVKRTTGMEEYSQSVKEVEAQSSLWLLDTMSFDSKLSSSLEKWPMTLDFGSTRVPKGYIVFRRISGKLESILTTPWPPNPSIQYSTGGSKTVYNQTIKIPPESDKKQEWERQNLLTLWPQEKLIFQSRRRKLWKDL